MEISQNKEKSKDFPAFPLATIIPPNGLETQSRFFLSSGMSLRDYFAGQCLTSYYYLQDASTGSPELDLQEISKKAYSLADAMLKAREL